MGKNLLIIILLIIVVILGVVIIFKVNNKNTIQDKPTIFNEEQKITNDDIKIENSLDNQNNENKNNISELQPKSENNVVTNNINLTQNVNNNTNKIQTSGNTTSVKSAIGEEIYKATQDAHENIANDMKNAAVQQFNAPFEAYVGQRQKGTQIKILILNISNNNNMSDEQVQLEFEGKTYSSDVSNVSGNIEVNKWYNVKLEYSSTGYVNKVIINKA